MNKTKANHINIVTNAEMLSININETKPSKSIFDILRDMDAYGRSAHLWGVL